MNCHHIKSMRHIRNLMKFLNTDGNSDLVGVVSLHECCSHRLWFDLGWCLYKPPARWPWLTVYRALQVCVFVWTFLWSWIRKDIDATFYCSSMSGYALLKNPYGAQICQLMTKSQKTSKMLSFYSVWRLSRYCLGSVPLKNASRTNNNSVEAF